MHSVTEMTWEQKALACKAIAEFSLRIRAVGDWYVSHSGVSLRDGALLRGGCVTGAATPEEAVNKHWHWLTGSDLAVEISREKRVRWNGFMWDEVAK